HGTGGVDAARFDYGRGPRAGGVGDLRVGAIVIVVPERLAVLGAQAQDTLLALADSLGRVAELVLGRLLGVGQLPVHHEDAVADNRRSAVAAADRHLPELLRPTGGE